MGGMEPQTPGLEGRGDWEPLLQSQRKDGLGFKGSTPGSQGEGGWAQDSDRGGDSG